MADNMDEAPSSSKQEEGEHDPLEPHRDPLLYDLPPFPSCHKILKANPTLSPADSNALFTEITVDGCNFPAMLISGEPRISVSQFKKVFSQKYPNFILEDFFGEAAIHRLLVDINAHMYNADPSQVTKLRIIDESLFDEPSVTFQMITVSDAHRVLGQMREESDELPKLSCTRSLADAFFGIPIQHTMCGDYPQFGTLYPSRKGGRCIQCKDCNKFFTPSHFVLHSHSKQEEIHRTVHWGISDDCWRYAIYMSHEDQKCIEWVKAFDEFMEDGFVEDDYLPPWFSRKNKEETLAYEPTKKKSRVEKESQEVFEVDASLAKILESAQVMPPIPSIKMDFCEMEQFNKTETRLRERVTAEAMQGQLFDLPTGSKPLTEEEVHLRAAEIVRCQQVNLPDPEAFPLSLMNCVETVQSLLTLVTLLEATLVDGKTNSTALQLLNTMKIALHRFSSESNLNAHTYAAVLGSYKTLNLYYSAQADPRQPLPDGKNFDEIRQNMAAMDGMGMMGPIRKPEGYVEMETVNPIIGNYIKSQLFLQTLSPKSDLATLFNPLITAALMNPGIFSLLNGKTTFNGLNGLNGLNGHNEMLNGKKHSLQEDLPSSSKTHTALPFNGIFSLTNPFSLISPAMKLGPEAINEELSRAIANRHSTQ